MDKKYLEQLKKEDYIAWDSLVNDPMIVGVEKNISFFIPLIIFIVAIIICCFFL